MQQKKEKKKKREKRKGKRKRPFHRLIKNCTRHSVPTNITQLERVGKKIK